MRNLIKGDFDKERNFHAVMKMVAEEKKAVIGKKLRKRIYFSVGIIAACMMIAVFAGNLRDNDIIDENGDKIFINEVELLGVAKLDADVVYEDEKKLIGETHDEGTSLFDIPVIQGMNKARHYFLYTRESDGPYDILHDEIYDFQTSDGSKTVCIALSDKGAPLRDYFFEDSTKNSSQIEGIQVMIAGMEQSYYALFQMGDVYIDLETNGVSQNQMVEIIKHIIMMNEA